MVSKKKQVKKEIDTRYHSWKTGILSLMITAIILILTSFISYKGLKIFVYFLAMIVCAVTAIFGFMIKRKGWAWINVIFFILIFINIATLP